MFFFWTIISWSFCLLGNEDFFDFEILSFFSFSKKKEKEMLLREGGV